MRKIGLFVLLIPVILIPATLSAQQKSKVVSQSSQEAELERKIEMEVGHIKNSGFYQGIYKYFSVREECRNCGIDSLLRIRYWGEGRCEDIKDSLEKDFCYALKNNTCDSLKKSGIGDFCKAMLNKDIDLLIKVAQSSNMQSDTGGKMDKGDVLEMLGLYYGFKYYSILACENFLKKEDISLSKQCACRIIFSRDSEKEIEAILKDMALLNLSREEKDSSLCNLIEDKTIRKKCLDPHIKNLTDLWDK